MRIRATPRPRSASRRFRAPTTALTDPEKRKQFDIVRGRTVGWSGRRRLRSRWRRLRVRERRPLRPARPVRRHFRGVAAVDGRARPQPERGADLEVARAGSRSRTPSPVHRCACPSRSTLPATPVTAPAPSPGTSPITCPQCGGSRYRVRLPRALRSFTAVPALPRQRGHRRKAVPHMSRHGPRAGHEAVRRQDPRRARRTAPACD